MWFTPLVLIYKYFKSLLLQFSSGDRSVVGYNVSISAVRKSGLDASIRKSSQLWYMNRNTNKVNLFSIHKLNEETSLGVQLL